MTCALYGSCVTQPAPARATHKKRGQATFLIRLSEHIIVVAISSKTVKLHVRVSSFFLLEDTGVAHHVLHLPHRDDNDLLGGIDLEDLHVVADGVPDDIVVAQLFFVRQDDSHPIFHVMLLWLTRSHAAMETCSNSLESGLDR